MNASKPLLAEFSAPSLAQWREEVERLLKGAPFARKMFTRLWEGLEIAPLYTEADAADIPWRGSLPGQAPFVRGSRAAGFHGAPWFVAQEQPRATAEEYNRALRDALSKGQTAANLVFDLAGMQCKDSDQAGMDEVGCSGTSISSLRDLAAALDGIDLARTPLLIQSGAAFLPTAAMLVALCRRRGSDVGRLRGCLGADVMAGLAQFGEVHGSIGEIQSELAVLTKWAAAEARHVRTLPVFEAPWHNGGADLALSLGLTLSSAVATLRAMESHGLAPGAAAPHFQFNLEIGTDFFLELAKLRAMRLTWSRILTAAGVPATGTAVTIHARTARRSLSRLDPHVNMLRGTTGAMSAVLGGCDSLHVSPFDEICDDPSPESGDFSGRIARNVQLILAHECHFDQVADPAGGSWYIDCLTRDLATAAWERFQSVEAEGGLAAALVSGWVQEQVSAAAGRRAEAYATRQQVLVGTNMYATAGTTRPSATGRDCAGLHRARTEALSAQRKSTTREEHLLLVARLEKVTGSPPEDLFERMIDAAEAGATLGEFGSVMRDSREPSLQVEPIPLRRDAEPFEALRRRVDGLREREPSRTRVLTLCLGDFARYMPRLEFVHGFLAVGGFEVVTDGFHLEPEAAVAAASAAGAPTVVLVGLDDTYATMVPEIAQALAAGPAAPEIMLAGLPGASEDAWRAAGVREFIHLRSNVLEALDALAARMEVRS